MAKESSIEKIRRLISNQKNVRNIATSAHIHHGKCVAGNSRVILTDGTIKTAREIFEAIIKDSRVIKENEEYTILSPNKEIEIFSLNKQTGKIERKEIKHAWRLIGGKTIKIRLRNGFEIETTPEHKYVTFRNGFVDVESKDLKLGERIVCARKLDTNSDFNIKKEILKKLTKENFYVNLNKNFYEWIKRKILDYKIEKLERELKLSIKTKSFYHGLWQNRINLNDLLKVCELFNINLEKVYDLIEYIYYRTGKQRGHNSLKIKLPKNFGDFFYLAGLFIGDGSGAKFIAGKEELGNRLVKICNELDIKTTKKQWKNKTPEIHTNKTLVYILNCLFDYPLKEKSHNVRISDFVFNSENKYIANLLRGYFDTDGCVEKSRRAITISSVSNKILEDLHLLLLRFGCVGIKEKDNTISISGFSAINFEKEVGFDLKEKKDKLRLLVEKVSGSIVCDSVNVGNQVMFVKKFLKDVDIEDLAFIEISKIEESYQDIVYDFTIPETHNFISEGIIIHNTAMTDNLLAAAGLMSEKTAGSLEQGMATWQHADEQERLLTVDAANVSMVHEYHKQEYLINLIDTPGHIDFSGNVTRAMRAIDGTFVLVCGVEGIMPQTETVLRQALKERVKPVLFINKVDRMIRELKLTPEAMQERFKKIIQEFNLLIEQIAESEYKEKWKVNVKDGSVAFGSAVGNWALSIPFMEKKGISFKDIYKLYDVSEEERKKWVWEKAPLYEVVLDMAVKHLPNPIEAQKYRIPKIWFGDLDSEFGKGLLKCDKDGEIAFIATRIIIDPRSGKEICVGRLYSGTIKNGMEVYCNNSKRSGRIQQVIVYNGIKPEQFEEVPAGNVLGIVGLKDIAAGETITKNPVEQPFEAIKHLFEPVVTKSIEAVKPADLPKLVEVLRQVAKEDPSIKIEINEQTGENLMSGMGELHLEIIENRIITEKGLAVITSSPIVVYRESVNKESPTLEGRSPNKHNSFYMKVEPLEENLYRAIKNGELPEGRIKKKNQIVFSKLSELGWSGDMIRDIKDIYKGNIFLDETRGEVHIGEVIEMVLDAFEMVVNQGPLAREPCMKMKVSLMDTRLHEDAIHRGPAQVYPAVREAITESMRKANASLLEPLQIHLIEVPSRFLGAMTKLVGSKRGQLLEVKQEGVIAEIRAKLPVAEMIGWSNDLRSATEGRGISSLMDQLFERVPVSLQDEVIRKIRKRKGLAENQ